MQPKKVYQTNLLLVLVLFGAYYFHPSEYLLWGAFGLLGICVFIYPLAKAIASGWMKFAEWLGDFNARVILFLIFYLMLTPWACLVRLIRPDPLKLDASGLETTFRDRNKEFTPEDFERVS